jgi:hypothetical protein
MATTAGQGRDTPVAVLGTGIMEAAGHSRDDVSAARLALSGHR